MPVRCAARGGGSGKPELGPKPRTKPAATGRPSNALACRTIKALEDSRNALTWESLQAVAYRLNPTAEVAFTTSYIKQARLLRQGKVPIDPDLLARLDPQEATFYIAYIIAASGPVPSPWTPFRSLHPIALWNDLKSDPDKAYARRLVLTLAGFLAGWALFFTTILLVKAYPYALVSIPSALLWLALSLTMSVSLALFCELSLLGQINKRQYGRLFWTAVELDGDEDAGRRFILKRMLFNATERGKRRLLRFERRMLLRQHSVKAPARHHPPYLTK